MVGLNMPHNSPGSAYPPSVEGLLPRVREWAADLGSDPSRNRIMTEFRVGAPKARAILAALKDETEGAPVRTLRSVPEPAQDSETVPPIAEAQAKPVTDSGTAAGPVMAASAAGLARVRGDLGWLGRSGPADRVRPDRTPAGDLGRPVDQLGDHAADRRRDLRRVRDAGVAVGLDRVRPGTRVRQVVHVRLAGPRDGWPGRLPPDDRRRRHARAVADHHARLVPARRRARLRRRTRSPAPHRPSPGGASLMTTTDGFRGDETGKVIAFPTGGRPAKSSAPEVVDAELVDESVEHPPAVDTPATDGSTWLDRLRTQDRQPIIPPYLRSLAEAKQAATWVGKHYAHKTGYHVARSPLYALRLAVRSPRGLLLLLAATGRYVTDAEGRPARAETATADKAELYLKLSQQRDRRVVLRWLQLGLVASVGLVLVLVLPNLLPGWVIWACGVLAIGLLGKLGSTKDNPVIGSRAVISAKVQKLTSDNVVHALSVLGIAGINQALAKNPDAIGFTAPIQRDGPGWRADVDLPPGVTVAEVIERRAKLASALGRPLGCVWPEGNAEVHPGRMVLWVGDEDMSKSRQPVWPLRKTGTRRPVQAAAVRHRPARPVGRDHADVHLDGHRRGSSHGQDVHAAGAAADRWHGPARRAARVRPQGHR